MPDFYDYTFAPLTTRSKGPATSCTRILHIYNERAPDIIFTKLVVLNPAKGEGGGRW